MREQLRNVRDDPARSGIGRFDSDSHGALADHRALSVRARLLFCRRRSSGPECTGSRVATMNNHAAAGRGHHRR
jgi:hypothetical protein